MILLYLLFLQKHLFSRKKKIQNIYLYETNESKFNNNSYMQHFITIQIEFAFIKYFLIMQIKLLSYYGVLIFIKYIKRHLISSIEFGSSISENKDMEISPIDFSPPFCFFIIFFTV